ncbi:MAG: CehA/McbA family metallohydrolase [Kofleriaceae bacterium]
MKYAAWIVLACCAGPDVAPPVVPQTPAPVLDAAPSSPLPADADADAGAAEPLSPRSPPDATQAPEIWLKGSTHVHARPSGDATTSIDDVMSWYEQRGYDFIVLTDHNRVSEVDGGQTQGQLAVHLPDPRHSLIVLSGIELTHNPSGCLPPGDPSKKCRIHVNVIAPTARPGGKLEWAERHSHLRLDMYRAALNAAKALGGALVQINHPQWFWGMTGDLLAELVQRGASLVEISNIQFTKWNLGDGEHPSTEALWDDVLGRGLTLWGVASDDAHDYSDPHARHRGKWPAGGGWIVVKARRDPRSIVDAIAAGHFYASTGVELSRAEVVGEDLIVEVDPAATGTYTIAWIENGKLVATDHGKAGRRALPASGYLRADVTRDDGSEAWVQPARR